MVSRSRSWLRLGGVAAEKVGSLSGRGRVSTGETRPQRAADLIKKTREDFTAAMDDDLNVSKALAAIFLFVHEANSLFSEGAVLLADLKKAKQLLLDFDKVLGLGFGKSKTRQEIIPPEIYKLAKERETARMEKDWARADKLRQEIGQKGYMVEDTEDGSQIKKASG